MIPCCAGHLLAALHILVIRFANLNYFFPQLGDALFDRSLHGDKVAEHKAPSAYSRPNVDYPDISVACRWGDKLLPAFQVREEP